MRSRPYRDPKPGGDGAISQNLAVVNDRLDQLSHQLARIAETKAAPRRGHTQTSDRVADALARIDRRLDQVFSEDRHPADFGHRAAPAPQPPPQPRQPHPPAPPPRQQPVAPPPMTMAPATGPATWAAQIAARQRALDGDHSLAAPAMPPAPTLPPAPAMAPPVAPPMPAGSTMAPSMTMAPPTMAQAVPPTPQAVAPQEQPPSLSSVEQQLRQINSQISALQQPYESGLTALRNDLAEIGRTLHDAMPRRAIEALETDVRALAERLDRSRQAGGDGGTLVTLEHSLGEIRDSLRGMMPAENLVGFDEAVRVLSHKMDQIAATTQGGHDPMALKQLEQAVLSLRGAVANVASDGALAQLAEEMRSLAGQVERTAIDSSAHAFDKLEGRLAQLMQNGSGVSPELEGAIRALSERLDRMQLSQGDRLALEALEDRIARLSEKLDASDSRLRHLDAIERGLADLLVHLETTHSARGPRAAAAPDTAPAAPHAAPQSLSAPPQETVHAPSQTAPAALPPPQPMQAPRTAPLASLPEPAERPATQTPRSRNRAPIEPNLPPDTPLEPGSGIPRTKPGSAAARIAASEAALGNARPVEAEYGGKSAALAAARNAAKAAYLDTPVHVPQTLRRRSRVLSIWPFRKRHDDAAVDPVEMAPPPPYSSIAANDDGTLAPPPGKRVLRVVKNVLVAASVAIIVIGAAQTAFDLIWPEAEPAKISRDMLPLSPPVAAPDGALRPAPSPPPAMPSPRPAPRVNDRSSSLFDPSSLVAPEPQRADVTGSVGGSAAPQSPPASIAATDDDLATGSLPSTIGPILRVAAAAKNPAAEYELGARYAEGRGVPQNMAEAVRWFERSAHAGFVPALFRLGSLHERGDGLKKDLQAARRYYQIAAGKGHAKAMHNLAVLYAEGIDGKPDYKVAAQWFRKAASHGVTDSQYNLAILYARGIGVETNLVEAYRWFALAAARGDGDAAKKRDEVAARLDPKDLTAARLAAQTFVPEREPEEATSLRAPPGGWDRATPAAAPSKPHRPATTAR